MTQAAELIDALNGTFGRHKTFRASHAKGFAVKGKFTPSGLGNGIDIPFLNQTHTVSARFSVGGGKPNVSDKSPSVRGFGLKIGSEQDCWTMALISAPVFFANSAEQFKAFLAARVPDPELGGPDPAKVNAFNVANQNTMPHQNHLKSTPPCACYSREHYHSGHAYGISQNGEVIWARIMLEATQGRKGLTEEEKSQFPDNFLLDAFNQRLQNSPARWTMKMIVASPADDLLDPTTPWTGDHQEIELGTIEIDNRDDSEVAQARIFDPSVIPSGIVEPKDKVFSVRSAAYSVSFSRRAK